MKVIRARQPEAVRYMLDYLVEEDDLKREKIAEVIKYNLTENPDDIYVLQAWEGEEIKAFLVATAPELSDFVFIFQAWCDPKAEDNLSDRLFYRVLLWAHDLGRNEIRMETKRDPEAYKRKWGFEVFSYMMNFMIPEDFEIKLANHKVLVDKSKEPENERGQRRRDQSEEHTDGGTETGVKKAGGVSDSKDRGGSGKVPRRVDSPSHSGAGTS